MYLYYHVNHPIIFIMTTLLLFTTLFLNPIILPPAMGK